MMSFMHYGPGYGLWGYGWIFQLIIVLVFLGVVLWMLSGNKRDHSNKTALDILKERLAKGEISLKEYRELKKELEEQ